VQLDYSAREVTLKLVYYGPALSGKTTNLVSLHRLTGAETRGRLMTLETQDDRTLFFDLLPLAFRSHDADLTLRIKLFTVPGQPIHAATRRLVLQGADGIAFIADSRLSATQANAESFVDLRRNLRTNGLSIAQMPLVIQFNKRDLPQVRSDAELSELAMRGAEPVYAAVATSGLGVGETLMGLLHLTWQTLDRTHQLERRLSIDGQRLLTATAHQIGLTAPLHDLLGSRLGREPPRRSR
jgi:signal recognition particle receptor subunit beta